MFSPSLFFPPGTYDGSFSGPAFPDHRDKYHQALPARVLLQWWQHQVSSENYWDNKRCCAVRRGDCHRHPCGKCPGYHAQPIWSPVRQHIRASRDWANQLESHLFNIVCFLKLLLLKVFQNTRYTHTEGSRITLFTSMSFCYKRDAVGA